MFGRISCNNVWTEKESFEEAFNSMVDFHKELRVGSCKTEVLGYGMYNGRKVWGEPVKEDWFELHTVFTQKKFEGSNGTLGSANIPASIFVKWGIIDKIEETDKLETFFNTPKGQGFIGYLMQDRYYI